MTAILLLIHDVPKAIQYIGTILNFIILAQYISHNKKKLCYIEYVLYRLENIKIAFKYYWSIDSKLY